MCIHFKFKGNIKNIRQDRQDQQDREGRQDMLQHPVNPVNPVKIPWFLKWIPLCGNLNIYYTLTQYLWLTWIKILIRSHGHFADTGGIIG